MDSTVIVQDRDKKGPTKEDLIKSGFTTVYVPSVLDQTVGRYYVHRIFTFRFPEVNNKTVTAVAKYLVSGLELTFAKYPVLTGFLGPADDDTKKNLVQVLYNDSRAIGSHVNHINLVTVQINKGFERRLLPNMPPFEHLVKTGMPAEGLPAQFYCRLHDGNPTEDWIPVFTLKTTILEESKALVLGFVFQHSVVDSTTMATVFDEFVRNLKLNPEEMSNVIGKRRVPYTRPSITSYLSTTPIEPLSSVNPTPINTTSHEAWVSSPTLVFTAKQIESIKDTCNNIACCPEMRKVYALPHDKRLTKTDCLSGLIWTASARARYHLGYCDPAQPIFFRTAVNARGKLSPPLPSDYIGNMFEHATIESYIGCLTQAADIDGSKHHIHGYLWSVASHALKIRQAIDGVGDASMRERLSRIAQLDDVQNTVSAIPAFDKANGLDFGSLATFGADLEFGIPGTTSSRAEFCRKVMPGKEGIANVLPRCGGTQGGADWEVVVSLRSEHAERMVMELEELGLLSRVANMSW
ncbi:unnamed protein product [Discula destructiva]